MIGEEAEDSYSKVQQKVRDKITHLLTIYPFLQPSMIHMGIGTSTPSELWKPILDSLKADGVIQESTVLTENAEGRKMSCTILHLTQNTYTYNKVQEFPDQNAA